ncbi:unnamed protein product [Linum tenue]|uniref:Uncharacterized protein n=1 Tax=Linum tenue TaxID=586396 RepID=A0AAV0IFZ5_9ROSI|nr:unnamed protein product [Linum tenue]
MQVRCIHQFQRNRRQANFPKPPLRSHERRKTRPHLQGRRESQTRRQNLAHAHRCDREILVVRRDLLPELRGFGLVPRRACQDFGVLAQIRAEGGAGVLRRGDTFPCEEPERKLRRCVY